LLSASKASANYLEKTLDVLGSRIPISEADYLRITLSKVLANNIENAISYLREGSSEERRMAIARALAHGLRRFKNRSQEFLASMDKVPQDYIQVLLAGCIRSNLSTPLLNDVVTVWLNSNVRKTGYRTILYALREVPGQWQQIVLLNTLDPQVLVDYEALSAKVSNSE
jgi:hypothetical protein